MSQTLQIPHLWFIFSPWTSDLNQNCWFYVEKSCVLDYEKHKNPCSFRFSSETAFFMFTTPKWFFHFSLLIYTRNRTKDIFYGRCMDVSYFWLLFLAAPLESHCQRSPCHVPCWFLLILQPPGLLAPAEVLCSLLPQPRRDWSHIKVAGAQSMPRSLKLCRNANYKLQPHLDVWFHNIYSLMYIFRFRKRDKLLWI